MKRSIELLDEELITEERRDGYESMLLKRFMELLDDKEEEEIWQEYQNEEHYSQLDMLYEDIDKLQEENFHLKKALKEIETLVERQLQEIHYAT